MKIRMIFGTQEGGSELLAGGEYDVADEVGEKLVANGRAERIGGRPAPEPAPEAEPAEKPAPRRRKGR